MHEEGLSCDSPKLPPEICDSIIDFLSDDRQSTATCGLVCRSWRSRSRYHLFYCLVMAEASTFALYSQILEESPHVADYTRDVYLAKPKSMESLSLEEDTSAEYLRFLPKLPQLTEMMLTGWNSSDFADGQNFPNLFPTVKILFLLSVDIEERDLMRLLRSCPRLTELRVCDMHVTPDVPRDVSMVSDVPAVAHDQLVYLQRMTFAPGSSSFRMVDALRNVPIELHLRMLQLVCHLDMKDSVENAQEILWEASPLLEQLEFAAVQHTHSDPGMSHLPLLDMPHLRVLTLKDVALTMPPVGDEESIVMMTRALKLNWMTDVLSEVLSIRTGLQKIQINLRMFRLADWLTVPRLLWIDDPEVCKPRIDWPAFDEALAKLAAVHPDLEISFYIRRTERFCDWVNSTVDALLGWLPQLTQKQCRLGITCFRDWAATADLGGGISGPKTEVWFPCPVAERDGDDEGYNGEFEDEDEPPSEEDD